MLKVVNIAANVDSGNIHVGWVMKLSDYYDIMLLIQ
jgi:hypothetical protein